MRSTTEDRYRISIAINADKLLVHVDGPEGPTLLQHLQELRRAAIRCGFEVVECQHAPVQHEARFQPKVAIRRRLAHGLVTDTQVDGSPRHRPADVLGQGRTSGR